MLADVRPRIAQQPSLVTRSELTDIFNQLSIHLIAPPEIPFQVLPLPRAEVEAVGEASPDLVGGASADGCPVAGFAVEDQLGQFLQGNAQSCRPLRAATCILGAEDDPTHVPNDCLDCQDRLLSMMSWRFPTKISMEIMGLALSVLIVRPNKGE